MKFVLTAKEILDRGLWTSFCKMRGINEWAVNEGLMDSSEEFSFTENEALEMGLMEQKWVP